ncbi:MAG: hypothetical protein M0T78_06840 [Actinomycetota bacterium]|nr:hypothetical protein [Actinomycetota bacterium]
MRQLRNLLTLSTRNPWATIVGVASAPTNIKEPAQIAFGMASNLDKSDCRDGSTLAGVGAISKFGASWLIHLTGNAAPTPISIKDGESSQLSNAQVITFVPTSPNSNV